MKETKSKILPFIIALSAASVSASAAFYSVSGLSKLFAGASTQVMIMAGSLEVAKLVIASLLYQYWDILNKTLRTYLSIAAVILVLITSIGIYGYLSAAYQETATKSLNADAQVTLLETKKQNFTQQRDLYNTEKTNLVQGITQLQSGLAGNKISYIDKKGNLIQSNSSSNRKSFEKQLDNSNIRQSEISTKLDVINDSIFKLDTQIIEAKTGNNTAGELGPLKYLSNLTGASMDSIINWLLLIIIFVFDPLAISLVIAANFAFEQAKNKDKILTSFEEFNKYLDEYELQDFNSTLNDGLEEDNFEPATFEDLHEDNTKKWREEEINNIKIQDEEIISPSNFESQEEEHILDHIKRGNFKTRPTPEKNIIDYN